MKLIVLFIIILGNYVCWGQVVDTIEVSYTKSAYMIFDDENLKYDVGSEDVIIRSSGNKLILQAQVENFEETNLLVDANGVVRVFIVRYVDRPSRYLYEYSKPKPLIEEIKVNKVFSDSVAEVLLMKNSEVLNRGVIKYKLGIYLRDYVFYDGKYYLKFVSTNRSNIPYKLDYFSMSVVNVKKRVKGESKQSIPIEPVGFVNMPTVFDGKSVRSFIVIVDPFVMTENKKLSIEFWEQNGKDMDYEGGRKVNFDLYYKDVLNLKKM